MQHHTGYDTARATALIGGDLDKVRAIVDEQLASESTLVSQTLEHVRSNFGKLLRPSLVLLSGRCCGTITPAHIQLGAIVELIHITTLLHDDVLDQSELRRGKATVNHIFGNEAAVLAGDFVFSKVFALCSELGEQQYSKILAATTTHICEGELEQTRSRHNWNLSEAQYLKIISKKSASLMNISCCLGALAADGRDIDAQKLANFGGDIGRAFQIIDDVLDYTGNENQMGKRRGNDLQRATVTLPIIHFLSQLKGTERTEIEKMLEEPQQNWDKLSHMLESRGSIAYAQSRAHEFYQQGIDALTQLAESQAKAAICEMAQACIDRWS